MNTPICEETKTERKWQRIIFRSAIGLVIYLLSTGPIAWATNDGLHPRYLPDQVNVIYLPLVPLMKIECVNKAFYFYTAFVWGGYPAGYTTL
jgi:hypothetical protein